MYIGGWMDKEYLRYLSIYLHKQEWNLAFYNNMDEPWGHYAEWNKSDRER